MMIPARSIPIRFRTLLLAPAMAVPVMAAAPLAAQDTTSREVVQPLPSKEVQRLNRALMQLARRPRSVDALLEAGDASLSVGDLDAAIGFYGRAEDISPNNARVKLGMARAFLRSGRPTDALPLFAAAQSAGAEARDLLSDRGLAFDLVGDPASAQAAYARAIALNKNDTEAKRRLALSYAISGNRAGFEETLRPLLEKRDFASFRTRAFGLAILGEQGRATAIVDAVMPRDLAGRINPYLAYMPRLTKAQQAAAANLGIFPKAADIGREDPRIAAYTSAATSGASTARSADSRLEPAGEPLGAPPRQATAAPEPGFDLARTGETSSPADNASVADAFADLGGDDLPDVEAGNGAVDIAAIEVPRETPPEPEPTEPVHPSRIWVQLATGRDVSALKFDWRRFARTAPDLLGKFDPHVTPWGEANRLLAGPVKDRAEARELINALKAKGIDTFRYTSPEGTEIKELK
ncbi:tetratricopeptide repeat protein [Erythrobacter sp. GH1-10]|uniref:tetratricopeptide repeat protein n=1 Tax=Erythrobacter sp. GH1-10 TaxID=3349334 RepID=UPI003878326B